MHYRESQAARGVAYYEGRGVPQDFTHARQWFEKAAAQGHAGAQNKLGVMYYEGQGVRQDHEQARRWFEKAAAQGSAAVATQAEARALGQRVAADLQAGGARP